MLLAALCLGLSVAANIKALFLAVPLIALSAWFGVGWLQARLPQGARSARKALHALEDLPAFWKS